MKTSLPEKIDKRSIILAALITGVAVGVGVSTLYSQEETSSKCEKTGEAIKNQSNLTGAIACFPPGVIDLNQTERVQEGSNLECVCRRSFEGNVQFWAINKAD